MEKFIADNYIIIGLLGLITMIMLLFAYGITGNRVILFMVIKQYSAFLFFIVGMLLVFRLLKT